MKQNQVCVGGLYMTKVGDTRELVRVSCLTSRTQYREDWKGGDRAVTAFTVRRVNADGTMGATLPKARTAAALHCLDQHDAMRHAVALDRILGAAIDKVFGGAQ